MRKINIHTDGGSRGNPGPAAIGVCIFDSNDKEIARLKNKIGVCTNNVAEYTAVITAMEWIKNNFQSLDKLGTKFSIFNFQFFLDSSLVVNQLNGVFKIKDSELKLLVMKIKNMEKEIKGTISYQYVPREENKIADSLVNDALDKI